MIAAPAPLLQEKAVQQGRRVNRNMGFFGQFARQTGEQTFSRLDAATRQIPAVKVSVAHQQNPALGIDDNGPHTKPDGMSQPLPQAPRGLQPSSG